MRPTVHCVTLPVDDIHTSFKFYTLGLGLAADVPGEDSDHVAFTLDRKLYLVITLRKDFATFTAIAGKSDAPKGSSECILSYFTGSKEEVDTVLQRVASADAKIAGDPKEQPWGYAGYFTDPDGHMWEVIYNPNMAAEISVQN